MNRSLLRPALLGALLLVACTGKKAEAPDAGPVDAGPPDAGVETDAGVVCALAAPGAVDLYAAANGDRVALAWVSRADEAQVASWSVGLVASPDAGACVGGQDGVHGHAVLLTGAAAARFARVAALDAAGHTVRADAGADDGGLGVPLTSVDVAVAGGEDAGFGPPVPVGSDTGDSVQVIALDTARQVVVYRAGTTAKALVTNSRGARFADSTAQYDGANQPRAAIDRDSGTLYLCYVRSSTPSPEARLATSTDQGLTWTDRIIATGTLPTLASGCDVTTGDGQTYVAFLQNQDATHDAVAVTRSGDNFASAVVVASGPKGLVDHPNLAWDSGRHLLVAAFDAPGASKSAGYTDVLVATSSDHGASFSTPGVAYDAVFAVTYKSVNVNNARLAVDSASGRAYVLFSIPVRQFSALSLSTDGAHTFSTGNDLLLGSDLGANTYAERPSVALAQDGRAWLGFTVQSGATRQAYVQVFDPTAAGGLGALGPTSALGGSVQSGIDTGPSLAFDPYLSAFAIWQDASSNQLTWQTLP